MRSAAVTVRLPGVSIAPSRSTCACLKTELENSGAKINMVAANSGGSVGMVIWVWSLEITGVLLLPSSVQNAKVELRDCLKISQSSNQDTKRSNLDHRLARLRQALIVEAETTMIVQPGQTTLDNPALGQDRKTLSLSLDYLQDPSPQGPHPIC